MFKNLKIRTKMTLTIALLVLLSVAATNYYSYSVAKDNIRKEVISSLDFHSQLEQQHLMDFIEQARRRVVDFSSDGLIRDSVEKIEKGVSGSQIDLNEHLSANKQSLDQYIYGINIYNMDSKIIASTSDSELGKIENDDQYITASRATQYGSSYVTDIGIFEKHFDKKTPSFVASSPIFNGDKTKRIGVIAVYFKAEEINEVLGHIGDKNHDKPKDTYSIDTYLVNKNGFLISPSLLTKGEVLEKKIDTLPVIRCKEGQQFSGIYKNSDNLPLVSSSRCMENGWTLILEVEEKKAFAAINRVKNGTLMASVLISISSLIFVYLLVKRSTRRINKLLSFTKRVGEGDLSPEIQIESKDEIGSLGTALNDMVGKMRIAQQGLEQEVEKRTGELEEMKKRLEKEIKEAKGETEALKEVQKASEMFKVSAESMIDGFAILSSIRKDGKITDFRYEYINEAGCKLNRTTAARILGRTLLEFLPNHKPTGLFEKYVQTAETGTPFIDESVEYEDYYDKEKLKRWFEIRAVKMGDGFAVTWRDVSEKQKNDAQIKEQIKQLEQFKDLTVGRELKMIELKNEIKELKKKLEA